MSNCEDILDCTDNFKKNKNIASILIRDSASICDPYITIAIPTYRRPLLLKEAIDSALSQKLYKSKYEVLIVDNEGNIGEITDTQRLINGYKDSRIVYYRNVKNLGMFGNWNRCIELARGEWIAFLHDDDILCDDYLKTIELLLKRKKNIGAISGNFRTFYKNINEKISQSFLSKIKDILYKYFCKFSLARLMKIYPIENILWSTNVYGAPTCGTIFKKNYLLMDGGFNEKYFPSSDWFFMYKYNMKHKIYRSVNYLGWYRISENESLKKSTIISFIDNGYDFMKSEGNKSFAGRIVFAIFGNIYHNMKINGVMKDNCNILISEFKNVNKYSNIKLTYTMYKFGFSLYWKFKLLISIFCG